MSVLSGAAGGALLTAFAITLVELTEVVAIVFALGATSRTLGPGFRGAVLGVVLVGGLGLVVGTVLAGAPETYSTIVGAALLWGFGVFLLRSTFKSYLRADRAARGVPAAPHDTTQGELSPRQLFGLGFSVGSVEALEAASSSSPSRREGIRPRPSWVRSSRASCWSRWGSRCASRSARSRSRP